MGKITIEVKINTFGKMKHPTAACIEMPQCAKIFAHPGSSILCSCKVYSRKFTFSSGM